MKCKIAFLHYNLFRYVTSLYFIVTTVTTVGYGDYSATNTSERLFLIMLEFLGISVFSIIMGNITSLKSDTKISDIISSKVTYHPSLN